MSIQMCAIYLLEMETMRKFLILPILLLLVGCADPDYLPTYKITCYSSTGKVLLESESSIKPYGNANYGNVWTDLDGRRVETFLPCVFMEQPPKKIGTHLPDIY